MDGTLPPGWDTAVAELSRQVEAAAQVTVDLTGRPPLREVRATVAGSLAFGRTPGEPLGAILLVLDELASNAYCHTGVPWRLDVTRETRGLLVEVSDGDGALDKVVSAGGHGLRLVGQLSLAWGIRAIRGGKTVWALVPDRLFREF